MGEIGIEVEVSVWVVLKVLGYEKETKEDAKVEYWAEGLSGHIIYQKKEKVPHWIEHVLTQNFLVFGSKHQYPFVLSSIIMKNTWQRMWF